MFEVWKSIPGYEGLYEVSFAGHVRSVDRYGPRGKGWGHFRGKVLKASTHHTGYKQVGLCRDGKQTNRLVHCLVMLAFEGPCPDGMETCHGDGDRANNRRNNLRYDTKQGNAADKAAHGTGNQGDTNPRANITAATALEIHRRAQLGEDQQRLAAEFAIPSVTVNHIATGKTWGSVTGAQWKRRHAQVTPQIVQRIRHLQRQDVTLQAIADQLGISKATAFRYSERKVSMKECT